MPDPRGHDAGTRSLQLLSSRCAELTGDDARTRPTGLRRSPRPSDIWSQAQHDGSSWPPWRWRWPPSPSSACGGVQAGAADKSGEEAAQEQVDLDPRVTAVVPVGPYPTDVAVGEGAVWVAVPEQQPDQDNLIVRIDPVTNEVVARIPDVSGPLAVGEGALWGVDHAGARAGPEGSTLLRIDPATNQVAARIALGVAAWDIEFGEGYVWVLSMEPEPGEGDILQIDPATNDVVARIEIPLPE